MIDVEGEVEGVVLAVSAFRGDAALVLAVGFVGSPS